MTNLKEPQQTSKLAPEQGYVCPKRNMQDIVHGIYKYVWNDVIVYIGKTDNSLKQRIYAHAKESKFQPYLKDAEIYYFETSFKLETSTYESCLIDRYKPVLNVTDNYQNNRIQGIAMEPKVWKNFFTDEPEDEERAAYQDAFLPSNVFKYPSNVKMDESKIQKMINEMLKAEEEKKNKEREAHQAEIQRLKAEKEESLRSLRKELETTKACLKAATKIIESPNNKARETIKRTNDIIEGTHGLIEKIENFQKKINTPEEDCMLYDDEMPLSKIADNIAEECYITDKRLFPETNIKSKDYFLRKRNVKETYMEKRILRKPIQRKRDHFYYSIPVRQGNVYQSTLSADMRIIDVMNRYFSDKTKMTDQELIDASIEKKSYNVKFRISSDTNDVKYIVAHRKKTGLFVTNKEGVEYGSTLIRDIEYDDNYIYILADWNIMALFARYFDKTQDGYPVMNIDLDVKLPKIFDAFNAKL